MSSLSFFSASRGLLLKLLLVSALATGVLASAAGRGTMAYFTTQVTSTANTFTTGSLHFEVAKFGGTPPNAAQGTSGTVSTSISLTNMKPGDTVFAPLTIKNAGSLDARWGIAYDATDNNGSTDNLAKALKVGIVGSGNVSSPDVANCSAAHFTDTTYWAEQILPLDVMTFATAKSVVSSTPLVALAGADGTYDSTADAASSLPLAHATTDVLCIEIQFPDGTPGNPDEDHTTLTHDNAWNGDATHTYSTKITFTVDGRQRLDPSDSALEFDESGAVATGNH
jgi:predicted ribosomally synthesized peptide with SipW-like signal peptide